MILYCTPDDVRGLHKLMLERADDFDDTYLGPFIKDATVEMNTALMEKYVVPIVVNPLPDILTLICKYKAASKLMALHFSDVNYKDDVPLSSWYNRQADTNLQKVIDNSLLSGIEGIEERTPPTYENRPRIAMANSRPNVMGKALDKFDRATSRDWRYYV